MYIGVMHMARTDRELLSFYQNEQASIKNGTGFSSDQGYSELINNKENDMPNKVMLLITL